MKYKIIKTELYFTNPKDIITRDQANSDADEFARRLQPRTIFFVLSTVLLLKYSY